MLMSSYSFSCSILQGTLLRRLCGSIVGGFYTFVLRQSGIVGANDANLISSEIEFSVSSASSSVICTVDWVSSCCVFPLSLVPELPALQTDFLSVLPLAFVLVLILFLLLGFWLWVLTLPFLFGAFPKISVCSSPLPCLRVPLHSSQGSTISDIAQRSLVTESF